MAREEHPLLPVAEEALRDALASQGVSLRGKGYCARAEDNLVETVTPELWAQARADLEAGKGTELDSKFLAAYSSSALAVNTFAPLRGRVLMPGGRIADASAPGTVIVGDIRFEQERSSWTQGFMPTLDAIVEADDAPVRLFVEGKCIEFLRRSKKEEKFSSAFVRKAVRYLDFGAADVYDALEDDPFAFDPLDARQLAKHFLAAKRVATAATTRCRVVLLCTWWEPRNAAEHPVFAAHRDATRRLAGALADLDVTLVALSHPELWRHWEAVGDDALRHHVACLRHRYDVELRG